MHWKAYRGGLADWRGVSRHAVGEVLVVRK